MTTTQDIRRALETQLLTIQDTSGKPEIAFENLNFDPSGESTWIRSRIEFTSRQPAGVGVGVDLFQQGIFLIDCFAKSNAGPASADSLADEIMGLFLYGNTFTINGVNVKIRFTERSGAIFDKPWYFVPITVTWYAYI